MWTRTPEHCLVASRYPTSIVKAAGRVYMANAASLYVMDAVSQDARKEVKADCADGTPATCNCVVTEESDTNEDEPPNGSGWRLVLRYPWAFYSPVPVVARDRWIWFLSGHSKPSPDVAASHGTLVYDTLTCAWAAGPEFHVGRCGAVAASLGPRLCVFGGEDTAIGHQIDGGVLDFGQVGAGWRKLPPPPFLTTAGAWYSAAYEVDNDSLRLVCDDGSAYDLALAPTGGANVGGRRAVSDDKRPPSPSDSERSSLPSDSERSSPPSDGYRHDSFETKGPLPPVAVWKPAPRAIPHREAMGRVLYFFDVASGVHVAFVTDHTPTARGDNLDARPLRVWMCSGEQDASLQWVTPRILGDQLFDGVCLIRRDPPPPTPDKSS